MVIPHILKHWYDGCTNKTKFPVVYIFKYLIDWQKIYIFKRRNKCKELDLLNHLAWISEPKAIHVIRLK